MIRRLAATSALLAAAAAALAAPTAPVRPVTDAYFGTTLTDPYRYMEDLSSPEVQAWARAQASEARAALDALPGRAKLLARLAELDDSVPARVTGVRHLPGDLWFYEKRGPSDNQFKLYMRQGLHGAEKLLVDPEALAKASGSPQAINFYAPSYSGKLVAYGISEGGSEEASIHVIDAATGRQLIAPIDRAHYSEASWLPDDSGFFYFRQRDLPKGTPETEKYKNQSAFFHRMTGGAGAGDGAAGKKGKAKAKAKAKPSRNKTSTPPPGSPDLELLTAGASKNIPIAAEEFPNLFTLPGSPLVFAIPGNGVQNEFDLYAAPRAEALKPGGSWRKLFDRGDDITGFAVHNDDLYVLTHKDAMRFKVLKTSLLHPDLAHAEVVIAPGREVVVGLNAAKDALYVQTRDGTAGKLYRVAFATGAKPEVLPLPREGSVDLTSVDARLDGATITLGSWTHDFTVYALDARSGRFTDTGLQMPGRFGAPDGIEAKEVLVKSWDGVEVPLSIVAPKGIRLDGSNPTHLYGYGSYGITDDPVYIPRFLAWYELGGVRATCHVRGGGAYGEEWHLAGKQATKPNTWKDFIACAEYLIAKGYTTPAKLAINGGSAGGILVGRTMTERPDLFAVAAPEVGVLNAVRAETSANGVPNIPEFGTVKDEKQFASLLEMDAYQHVKDGVKYPATILFHGINDPRVPPWMSLKMAARLQAATASGKPVLLRIGYDSGHGIGSTKKQRQEEYADLWSFMLWQFGDLRFQPLK